MGSARLVICLGIVSLAACRPTADGSEPPVASRDGDELERARGACERRESGGCERLELEQARLACAAGVLDGCDHYDLAQALCLEHPRGPLCDAMRRRGDLPSEPPPLAEAFGCRRTEGLVGPAAVVCLAEDRVSIRDAGGAWEQWQVQRWGREDTVERAIWVATLRDGAPLWLTTTEVEVEAGLCVSAVVRSRPRRAPGSMPPVACTKTVFHVAGSRGLLRATLGERDSEAELEIGSLPTVEAACIHADACERELAAARPRPSSVTGAGAEEVEGEAPAPSHGPQTLQHCRVRLWSAMQAEHGAGRVPPAMCIVPGDGEPPPMGWSFGTQSEAW